MRGRTQMRGNSWTYIVDFERDSLTGKRKQILINGFTSQKEAQLALGKYLGEAEEKHISIRVCEEASFWG